MDATAGPENDDLYLQFSQWFHLLSKYYSTSLLLRECSAQKIMFPFPKQENPRYQNEPQILNVTWLQDVVYILSSISYRKEVNHLENVQKTEYVTGDSYKKTELYSRDLGRMAFNCILSHGRQILMKVNY